MTCEAGERGKHKDESQTNNEGRCAREGLTVDRARKVVVELRFRLVQGQEPLGQELEGRFDVVSVAVSRGGMKETSVFHCGDMRSRRVDSLLWEVVLQRLLDQLLANQISLERAERRHVSRKKRRRRKKRGRRTLLKKTIR